MAHRTCLLSWSLYFSIEIVMNLLIFSMRDSLISGNGVLKKMQRARGSEFCCRILQILVWISKSITV